MSFAFSSDGLTIQTYQEIFDELAAGYRLIYGPDINLAPDSPDGQRVGIEAKARLDIQTFALALYNQIDPDFSAGEMQNKIIKLAGLSRGVATRSQVDVSIVTDRALTLPIGYTVQDDLGQNWVSDSPLTIAAPGTTVTTLFAENFGSVGADPGTVTTPIDLILGVISVTNPAAATAGRDEETDEALRLRRNRSLVSPATSSRGGLYTALGNLEAVTDLQVYENETDVLDAVLNLEAHSIWCVVSGGDVPDIVETIAKNKTGGTGIKGTVTGTYTETVIRPDGTTYDLLHDMAFDRPVDVPLYVHVTVQAIGAAVVDTVAIQNALAAHAFRIADIARASELYSDVYSVADNFIATILEISDDDIAYTDGALTPAADEVYSVSAVNVTVTVI